MGGEMVAIITKTLIAIGQQVDIAALSEAVVKKMVIAVLKALAAKTETTLDDEVVSMIETEIQGVSAKAAVLEAFKK
jgi:hypothetical protein